MGYVVVRDQVELSKQSSAIVSQPYFERIS